MCKGVLSGRTLLMWAKFWQADKISSLARWPLHRQPGGLREPRTRIAPRSAPEISHLPHVSSFPVASLLFVSVFFHSGLEGGVPVAFPVRGGRGCVATFDMRADRLLLQHQPAACPTSQKACITRRNLNITNFHGVWHEHLNSVFCCDIQCLINHSFTRTELCRKHRCKCSLIHATSCGRCTQWVLFAQPCQILYATAASGGSRLASQSTCPILPKSRRVSELARSEVPE
jgi:hypothetical protein